MRKVLIVLFYQIFIFFYGCPQRMDFVMHDAISSDSEEKLEYESREWLPWWQSSDEYDGEMEKCEQSSIVIEEMGCREFEMDFDGVCTSAINGTASFRFQTSNICTGSVLCSDMRYSQSLFEKQDNFPDIYHQLVLFNLPRSIEIICNIYCSCPDVERNLDNSLVSFKVFIPDDSGIRITEVLINPKGKEPQQEFVEIINTSGFPLDISGWKLTDSAPAGCWWGESCNNEDGDEIPAGTIIGHMIPVLLVPQGFNENDPVDPIPPEGCTLIRLDESLGERGLRNSGGEPVFLITLQGQVAGFYPNYLETIPEGVSVERVSLDLPDGFPDTWMKNPNGTATPCEWNY